MSPALLADLIEAIAASVRAYADTPEAARATLDDTRALEQVLAALADAREACIATLAQERARVSAIHPDAGPPTEE